MLIKKQFLQRNISCLLLRNMKDKENTLAYLHEAHKSLKEDLKYI